MGLAFWSGRTLSPTFIPGAGKQHTTTHGGTPLSERCRLSSYYARITLPPAFLLLRKVGLLIGGVSACNTTTPDPEQCSSYKALPTVPNFYDSYASHLLLHRVVVGCWSGVSRSYCHVRLKFGYGPCSSYYALPTH